MALGGVVVRTRGSFRQSYAPTSLVGRFIAFTNAHIVVAKDCSQHGAHPILTHGLYDVLVDKNHFVERSEGDNVAYPGLVLCVTRSSPGARENSQQS